MATIHKSYLISLCAFLGINITFGLIYTALSGGFTSFNPLSILGLLVQAIFFLPTYLVSSIIGSGGDLGLILLAIGSIAACVVSAVLSGYFGESKGAAFGGWGLTIVTAFIMGLILCFIEPSLVQSLSGGTTEVLTYTFGTYQEEIPTVMEIQLIFDAIGVTVSNFDIIIYRHMIMELGGVPNVIDPVIAFSVVQDYDADTAVWFTYLINQISDKGLIEQYILFNTTFGWDLELTITNTAIVNASYSPVKPNLLQTILYVSITGSINGVFYGMFALGAKRAAFY
jgi:hypothetical protein